MARDEGLTLPPEPGEPPTEPNAGPLLEGPRYRDLGSLGAGGMGEVRRVEDRLLRRIVAMKLAHPDLLRSPADVATFLAEARVHAGLVHPNIVPVFDLGELPGGRVYFTMQEVVGRTLRDAIREHHRRRPDDDARALGTRRLVEALRQAAEGVAFSHAAGVVHRDLKPGNIMLGAFGEVLVMDWGLARASAISAGLAELRREEGLSVRLGAVSGTPAYMPPEQARGDLGSLDARADVYSLGAVLYEILSGSPPYKGEGREALAAVLEGPPPKVSGRSGGPIPVELVELCERAMSRDPEARPQDAGAFVAALRAWLEGQRRREEARALLVEADALYPRVLALRAEARSGEEAARAALAALDPWAPDQEKAPHWARQDEAERLAREADLLEIAWLGRVQGALERAPDLVEGQTRLADHYQAAHVEAEARGRQAEATRLEALLRRHDQGRHARYLRGQGALSLHSDPPAEVTLCRWTLRGRRLVAEPDRVLGVTPLGEVPVLAGSYLLVLRAGGFEELRLPVHLGRLEHHQDLPPGGTAPVVHRLAREGELSPDERLVPAGWFMAGDDGLAPRAWPAGRRWTDAFVMRRDPITLAELLGFVNGSFNEIQEIALPGALERDGSAYTLTKRGSPPPRPDWPAILVSWTLARALARWSAARDGLPWQLPQEVWWEKAARGVDGRAFPTGEHLDPTWAATRDSGPVALGPSPVGQHADESVYGVRGLAGNVRCWCVETTPQGTHPARGGAWNFPVENCKSALRTTHTADTMASNLGVRLARGWG